MLLSMILALSWLWMVYRSKDRRIPEAQMCTWIHDRLSPKDLVLTIPGWMIHSPMYYLSDIIPAEQILCDSNVMYHGQPANPLVTLRILDCRQKEIAVMLRHHASQDSARVWVIRKGFSPDHPSPETADGVLKECYQCIDSTSVMGKWFITASLYIVRMPAAVPETNQS